MSDEICGLCDRPMPVSTVSQHHLIPKSRKGTDTVPIHKLCHNKIHSLFTEKEIERNYATLELLRLHPDIQIFVDWVRNKPPEFYVRTKEKR